MKKIFLVITLLTSFFLSPVKADSYTDNPYIVIQGEYMGQTYSMYMYFDPSFNEKLLYYENNYIILNNNNGNTPFQYTVPDLQLVGLGSFPAFENYAEIDFMGQTVQILNFHVLETGNGFKWYNENENVESNIDLSTIQTYLLIISFLLFVNFLRG